MRLEQKLRLFYLTSIFGAVIAVMAFSYNAWRMEISEDNNNIRTAAFEVLLQLSEMEQIIYAAHYDKNLEEGSPRKAWVKMGLISDLSGLISSDVEAKAGMLNKLWSESWHDVETSENATKALVNQIDQTRASIKIALKNLE